jgi:mRNA interferase YafQ
MFDLEYSTQFKKDLKKIKKQNAKELEHIKDFLKNLQKEGVQGVDVKMKPHKLKGKYNKNWECHIKPDLLIVWIQVDADNVISLVRLGSHSELF